MITPSQRQILEAVLEAARTCETLHCRDHIDSYLLQEIINEFLEPDMKERGDDSGKYEVVHD